MSKYCDDPHDEWPIDGLLEAIEIWEQQARQRAAANPPDAHNHENEAKAAD